MGIAEQLKPKITQIGPGLGVGAALARGEGEIGFTQMSELMSVEGIAYLGPLPAEIQMVTVFSAGIHTSAPAADAAGALLKTEEAAALLGVSQQLLKINRMHGVGLPFVKFGRTVRYNRRDLDDYVRQNTIRPQAVA